MTSARPSDSLTQQYARYEFAARNAEELKRYWNLVDPEMQETVNQLLCIDRAPLVPDETHVPTHPGYLALAYRIGQELYSWEERADSHWTMYHDLKDHYAGQ